MEAKWKEFEQLVFQLQKQLSKDSEVISNTKLDGEDSRTKRQIDILVKRNIGQYSITVVMECKDYKKPIDVKEIEAFATKLKDVKANKGAMISSKGFTKAALETAKRYGIDMFRFVDTKSTNWKAYASISMAVEKTIAKSVQFKVSPIYPFLMNIVNSIHSFEVFNSEMVSLGILGEVLSNKWENKEIPRQIGIHEVELIKNGFLNLPENVKVPITIYGMVDVEKKFFSGQIPVDLIGFKDEHNGGVITRSFTTTSMEVAKLVEGNLEGWKEVSNPMEWAVKPFIIFSVENDLKDIGNPANQQNNH